MKNKILIIHPSRQRCKFALSAYNNIINNATYKEKINYIFCVDNDDPTLNEYKLNFNNLNIVNNTEHTSLFAINSMYSDEILDKHDFVIHATDDFRTSKNWDEDLYEVFNKVGYDKLIKTKQPGGRDDIVTMPIAGSLFFKEYGFFVYPEYKALFADDDMTAWAHKRDKLVHAEHIIIPHLHYTINPNLFNSDYGEYIGNDEIYKKQQGWWSHDENIWNRRKNEI